MIADALHLEPGTLDSCHLQEEALGWRAKATEAIGMIAEAIGIEPFRPHVQGIMQAAFQVRLAASSQHRVPFQPATHTLYLEISE